MNRSIRRTSGLAALALTATLGLAACSSDSSDTASESDSPTAAESSMTSDDAMDAGAQTFGAGCSAVPTEGDGSFDGMASEPVATAASANPLL